MQNTGPKRGALWNPITLGFLNQFTKKVNLPDNSVCRVQVVNLKFWKTLQLAASFNQSITVVNLLKAVTCYTTFVLLISYDYRMTKYKER